MGRIGLIGGCFVQGEVTSQEEKGEIPTKRRSIRTPIKNKSECKTRRA